MLMFVMLMQLIKFDVDVDVMYSDVDVCDVDAAYTRIQCVLVYYRKYNIFY